VSVIPIVLHGSDLRVLVVGGGPVADRKVCALLAGGASIRIVAPEVCDSLRELAADQRERVHIERRGFLEADIGDALLVIAATDDPEVNARVIRAARSLGRLVNVADDAAAGDCSLPAVHRAGALHIAVYAGGLPVAAARIRDAIGERFDGRYGAAIEALSVVRRTLLGRGDRSAWHRVAEELIGERFCDDVEGGRLTPELGAWR
jgi:precorrin-2 dehydrogenase/sirohydrochlorin ferrochelatase